MAYRHNNDYYMKMTRKFVKLVASLDKNGDVNFTPTNEVIELSDISDLSDYKEVTLDEVKKDLTKKSEIKEEKEEIPNKKINKFTKLI